jgi:hypothetical protein
MIGYSPCKTICALTADAAFDPSLSTSLTILELDGEPGRLECWRELALKPQTLRVPPARVGAWGEFEKLCYSQLILSV